MSQLKSHNFATFLFGVTKYGLNYTDPEKNNNLRNFLVEQQKSEVKLLLSGLIDNEPIEEKSISGILTVGKDIKGKIPSHTPELKKIIAILLESINKKDRCNLLKKFSTDPQSLFDNVNPIYEALANELMADIRKQECYRTDVKGPVSFRFVETDQFSLKELLKGIS